MPSLGGSGSYGGDDPTGGYSGGGYGGGEGGFGGLGIGNPGSYGGRLTVGAPGYDWGWDGPLQSGARGSAAWSIAESWEPGLGDFLLSAAGTLPGVGLLLSQLDAKPSPTTASRILNAATKIAKGLGAAPLQNMANIGMFGISPGAMAIGTALNLTDRQNQFVKDTLLEGGLSPEAVGQYMDSWGQYSLQNQSPMDHLGDSGEAANLSAGRHLQDFLRAYQQEQPMYPYGVDPQRHVNAQGQPMYNSYRKALIASGIPPYQIPSEQDFLRMLATGDDGGGTSPVEGNDPPVEGEDGGAPPGEDPPAEDPPGEDPPAEEESQFPLYDDFLKQLLGSIPELPAREPMPLELPEGSGLENYGSDFQKTLQGLMGDRDLSGSGIQASQAQGPTGQTDFSGGIEETYRKQLQPYIDAVTNAGKDYEQRAGALGDRHLGLADDFLAKSNDVYNQYQSAQQRNPTYNIKLPGVMGGGSISTPSRRWGDYNAQQAATAQGLIGSSAGTQSQMFGDLMGNYNQRFANATTAAQPLAMPVTMAHDINQMDRAGSWDMSKATQEFENKLGLMNRQGQIELDKLLNAMSGDITGDMTKMNRQNAYDMAKMRLGGNIDMDKMDRAYDIGSRSSAQEAAARLESDIRRINRAGEWDLTKMNAADALRENPELWESLLPAIAYGMAGKGGDVMGAITKIISGAAGTVGDVMKWIFGDDGDQNQWFDDIWSGGDWGDDGGWWDGLVDWGGDIWDEITSWF